MVTWYEFSQTRIGYLILAFGCPFGFLGYLTGSSGYHKGSLGILGCPWDSMKSRGVSMGINLYHLSTLGVPKGSSGYIGVPWG